MACPLFLCKQYSFRVAGMSFIRASLETRTSLPDRHSGVLSSLHFLARISNAATLAFSFLCALSWPLDLWLLGAVRLWW